MHESIIATSLLLASLKQVCGQHKAFASSTCCKLWNGLLGKLVISLLEAGFQCPFQQACWKYAAVLLVYQRVLFLPEYDTSTPLFIIHFCSSCLVILPYELLNHSKQMITLPVLMAFLNLGVGWLYYPPGNKGKTVGRYDDFYWFSPSSICYDSSLLPLRASHTLKALVFFPSSCRYATVCDLLDCLTESTGGLGVQ